MHNHTVSVKHMSETCAICTPFCK